MSYVNAVKEKHRFEQSMRELFQYLSVMSIEELELAMAHIADDILVQQQAMARLNGLTKGAALRTYLSLRTSGQLAQKRLKRILYRPEMKRYFEGFGVAKRSADLATREERMAELRRKREDEMAEYRAAHAEWSRKRDALPFFKRLFGGDREPHMPPEVMELPFLSDVAVYVKEAQIGASLEAYFVDRVRRFEISALPETTIDFSRQEVVLLNQ
jgi:hypothetical protein